MAMHGPHGDAMAIVCGSAVVGVNGQAFSSERSTRIVRRDRKRSSGGEADGEWMLLVD